MSVFSTRVSEESPWIPEELTAKSRAPPKTARLSECVMSNQAPLDQRDWRSDASDEALMLRFRDLGDRAAFECLVHRYENELNRIDPISRSRRTADDMLKDVDQAVPESGNTTRTAGASLAL
jgi:hypothetical protein